jgi:hypothetical protein
MNPVSGNATGYNIVRYPSGMAPSSGGAYASHPFGSSPGSPPVDAPVGSIIVNPQISQGGAAAGTGVTGLGAWNPVTGNVPVGVNAGSNSFAAVAPVSFGTISPGSSVMIAPSGGPAGYDDGPSLGAWLDDRPAYARDVASWLSDTIGRNTNSIASVAPALAVLGPYGALASVALEAVAGRSAGLKQSGAPTTESAPGVPGPAPGASSASQNLNPSSTPAWLIPAIGVGALLLLSRK